MVDRAASESVVRHARVAGLAYLIIIAAGIYAEFFVRSSLVVPGDATTTASNIASSELLFRSGLASEFIMLACDVLIAVMLYVVFEPVSRTLSLLAASCAWLTLPWWRAISSTRTYLCCCSARPNT
jgi:hypothetical protein